MRSRCWPPNSRGGGGRCSRCSGGRLRRFRTRGRRGGRIAGERSSWDPGALFSIGVAPGCHKVKRCGGTEGSVPEGKVLVNCSISVSEGRAAAAPGLVQARAAARQAKATAGRSVSPVAIRTASAPQNASPAPTVSTAWTAGDGTWAGVARMEGRASAPLAPRVMMTAVGPRRARAAACWAGVRRGGRRGLRLRLRWGRGCRRGGRRRRGGERWGRG